MEKQVNIFHEMIDKTFSTVAVLAALNNESVTQAVGRQAIQIETVISEAKHKAILEGAALTEKMARSKDVSPGDLVSNLVELTRTADSFGSLLDQVNKEVFAALHKTGVEQSMINEKIAQHSVMQQFGVDPNARGPVVEPPPPTHSNSQGKSL